MLCVLFESLSCRYFNFSHIVFIKPIKSKFSNTYVEILLLRSKLGPLVLTQLMQSEVLNTTFLAIQSLMEKFTVMEFQILKKRYVNVEYDHYVPVFQRTYTKVARK